MLQKIYISNKCYFEPFYSSNRPYPEKMYHSFHKNIAQHNNIQKCFLSIKIGLL